MRIVQMTSVHGWQDTRVFAKMCRSVAAVGHEVHLVVPAVDGPSFREVDGVAVHFLPLPRTRRERMSTTVRRVLEVAAGLDGDLYQFHDPEFLLHAVRFQDRVGRPVVFDSHEDYRLQVRYKHYLPRILRPLASRIVGITEDRGVRRLGGVIAATPSIAERFAGHPRLVVVQNFPILEEFSFTEEEAGRRRDRAAGYVGGLSRVRGALQMIVAVAAAGADIRLELAGHWSTPQLREACSRQAGWAQVVDHGFLSREAVRVLLGRVSCGLVLLHPEPSYLAAYPVKLFEYMAAGLPVVASDFPLWRRIVAGCGCGLLTNPLDTAATGTAIRRLVDDPDEARRMGRNGRTAVETKYGWERERQKLLEFYAAVSGRPA